MGTRKDCVVVLSILGLLAFSACSSAGGGDGETADVTSNDLGLRHRDAGRGSGSSSGGSSSGSRAADTGASSAFVTASGTSLMLDGKVFQFIGFNAYGMTGCFNGAPWSVAQLDAYFAGLPANGMTRIWAFQPYGVAAITTIVNEAAKYNQHLVLSLWNDDGNCEGTGGANLPGMPLSFYQSGWQGSYLTWIQTIVPEFKDNPTIAMWEIANEPGQETTVPEATMKAYLAGTAAAIKALDSNHLVETGVADQTDVGNFEDAQDSPDIDVLCFHDYAYDYEKKAIESASFAVAQAAAVALHKPFIAGEAGVESGPTCTAVLTEAERVTYLQTKANDYFRGIPAGSTTAGTPISGIMFWEYEPANTYGWKAGQCEYDLFPGDPLIPMVKNYVVP